MIKLLPKTKGFSFRKQTYTLSLLLLISFFGYSQITVIHTASFESGLNGWTDGGSDAQRDATAARAYDGTFSLRVRDNSSTSNFISPSFNISTYNKVDFSFFFYSQSMENAENFFIEYRDNNAASWVVIRDFIAGDINFSDHTGDFQRDSPGVFYAKTATIHSTSSTFSSTAQFRVRCDASGNDDQIYVDDITIEGTTYNSITDAPGGVTSGLELWLKANEVDGSGVIADNTNLNEWVDSGKGHNARTNTTAQAPLYKNNTTDNINFNPVIDFENSSAASNPDMQYIGSHAGSADELKGTGGFYSHDAFIVTIPDETITTGLIPLDTFCSSDPAEDFFVEDVTGFGYGAYSARFTNEVLTYCLGTTSSGSGYGRADTTPAAITDYNQVGIVNFRHNAANNGEELYFNANNVGDAENDIPDFTNVSNTRFWLGRSQKWSGSFGGRIAEVVTYSSRKTDGNLTQERNRIQSYLAIKYGITLGVNGTSQDYVDSAGSVIWDQSANSGYNYHITGIGRDDDSELNQKQSKTVNTADDITMGLTDIATTNSANVNTFSTDNSYLVWGNDQGTLAAQPAVSVDMSAGIGGLNTSVQFQSFDRTWKVVESGTIGTTKVSIPSSMLTPTLPTPGGYLMFISSSPTFSPTSEYRNMTLVGGNYETDYDFNGIKYITFGYAPEETFIRSIYFDGIDDYLDAGDVLDLTGSFSISAWIKRDTGAVSAEIISKRNIPYTDGYSLRLDGTGRAIMFWKNLGGTTQQIQSTAVIPENEWHHIAVTYDGIDANIYIDGVIEGAATTSLDPPVSSTERFLIAATNYTSPTRFFQGNIDEVRVWSVALTEDQLHYIMNQEIEDNTNVAGSYFTSIGVTPTKEDVVSWSNLEGYYPMSTYTFTNAKDESNNGYTAALVQLNTVDFQTAPLPYISSGVTTDWDTNTTWTNGSEQTIPGATSIVNSNKTVDGNIVSISHDITMDNSSLPAVKNGNRTLLSLIVNSNELIIEGNTTLGTGNGLTISHYLELDGDMDLQGESQLIQTDQSDLAVSSSGSIERDQQGTANSYTYNYFSSPVSAIGTGANNVSFNVEDVLFDGTIPDDATRSIDFGADGDPYYSDGAVSDPVKITPYWLYKFVNLDNDYASWQWIGNDDVALNVTEGFTMKGISSASSISTDQNYVFIGKPNNVLNGATQIIHTTFSGAFDTNGNAFTTLTGNPFPSAMDADQFIADNIDGGGTDAITGTLYFWEHWGGGSHEWRQYQGGYATYTTAGGTAATSHPDIDQTGVGTKTPGQYIPVAQGFYVIQEHDDDGSGTVGGLSNPSSGNVAFNNGQRIFQKEFGNIESVFTRNTNTSQTTSITTDSGKQRIWLGFKSPDGYHRQVLAAFLEGATDGIDRGYDGRSGSFLSNDAFFMQDNKYFVIQAFGEFNEDREIPISIFIDSDNDNGLQTFMIDRLENIPEDVEIYIKDNITGETYDIKNQDYEVNLATGEHKTRFSLVFKASSLSVEEVDLLENGINAFMNNTTSTIDITRTIEVDINKVTLYNYLGQTVQVWTDNLLNNELNLPVNKTSTGAYILKIETKNKTLSKKLIIE